MTNDEIKEALDKHSSEFEAIRGWMASIDEKLAPIPQIQKDAAEAKAAATNAEARASETKEIVDAWNAVKTGGRFLKWAAGVLGSIGILYASARGYIGVWFK